MRNVGKWMREESGKHPVNVTDEEIFARRDLTRDDTAGSYAR
jgi:hypothetical protein